MSAEERIRLAALQQLGVEYVREQATDDLAALAAAVCGVPIGMVNLVEADRVRMKGAYGTDLPELPREGAPCSEAIKGDDVLELSGEAQFPPNVPFRFYAGMPLITKQGQRIGTICALHTEPKRLSEQQKNNLRALARQTMRWFEQNVLIASIGPMLDQLREAESISKIGSWHVTFADNRTVWSSELYRIFDIAEPQPADQLQTIYRSRIHPDDIVQADAVLEQAMRAGADFLINFRIVLDGGRVKHLQGIGRVTLDGEGKPSRVSGTCRDRTADIEAEAKLTETRRDHQFVLDAIGVGVWRFDTQTNEVFWDDSMRQLYEMSPKPEDTSEAWRNALSPETRARTMAEIEVALREGREFNFTFEITTPSGKQKSIGCRGRTFVNERNSTIVQGISWDRTKEVATEKQIAQQKVLIEQVLNNLPNMIFAKDYQKDGRYSWFNETGARLIGYPAKKLIGKNDFDFFPKEQAEFFVAKDKEVFQHGRPMIVQCELVKTVQGDRWMRTCKVPTFHPNGSPDMLIGISTDITDELRLKESLEQERAKAMHNAKLASLGEMSAGIAHEINNPLMILSGTIGLLPKLAGDPVKLEAKLANLRRAVDRISKIVSGLRKFARTTDGVEHQPHQISEIVRECITLVEAKARRHFTDIEVDLRATAAILCDSVEIEQVLVNLLNNAIDAVKRSATKRVTVRTFDDGREVVVRVLDSGAGVPAANEDKIFQPFFTTKPVGQGTGLGLSIAKGILAQHRATLTLNRHLKVTCFEIRFNALEEVKHAAAA